MIQTRTPDIVQDSIYIYIYIWRLYSHQKMNMYGRNCLEI